MISVTVARPDAALDAHWDTLRPFAHNAFMHPAALRAAGDAMFAVIYVLLAWEMSAEPAKLVGYWALQVKHLGLWQYLEALPFNYAFLSTPVLHPDYAEDVMPAFLAAIASSKELPNTVVLKDLDAEGREYSAIEQAMKALPHAAIRTDQRPIATRTAGIKRSGSTRRKLKQDWNRLAALGDLKVTNVREPAAVVGALEDFLVMEAAGWKGNGGTALLSRLEDAAFARKLIANLAADGNASVAVMTLDGQPVAAQVLLYCGKTAYTWKTSYDTAFAKHSPGTLLVDRIATDLLDSGDAEVIDSCALGEGFMAQLWSARKPMVDIALSTKPASVTYRAVAGYLKLREELKRVRGRLGQQRRPAPAAAPATPDAGAPAQREASERDSTTGRAA